MEDNSVNYFDQKRYPDIIDDLNQLSVPCDPFDFQNPVKDPVELSQLLIETLYHYNGIGLSANQIGINARVFAVKGSPENYVFFNPRIVDQSSSFNFFDEGCLSFPGLSFNIKRSNEVRLRFDGPDGQTYTKVFKGMTARVIQHEMNHLDGQFFWKGLSRWSIEKAIKQSQKRGFDYQGKGMMKWR